MPAPDSEEHSSTNFMDKVFLRPLHAHFWSFRRWKGLERWLLVVLTQFYLWFGQVKTHVAQKMQRWLDDEIHFAYGVPSWNFIPFYSSSFSHSVHFSLSHSVCTKGWESERMWLIHGDESEKKIVYVIFEWSEWEMEIGNEICHRAGWTNWIS